tara:strand:+ start:538 stop:801 length:264 start_codon:yes stop_codon:yes gene_type:complete
MFLYSLYINVRLNKNLYNEYKVFLVCLNMIFRDANGKLVEIKRYDFTTDVQYFKKLISLKQAKDNLYQKMQNASQHLNTLANDSNPK